MECPICGSAAADEGSRDYGDKARITCPRCGPYEISGTALVMLESRVSDSPNDGARLSHALRMKSKKDVKWFMVTSANFDELASQPLPDVDTQFKHLLEWLKVELGDDRLGRVSLNPGTINALAGIVGAVDAERVSRLIKYAENEGFIEVDYNRELGLTPKGWKLLKDARKNNEAATPSKPAESKAENHDENKVVTVNCNKCGGERQSFQRRLFEKFGTDSVTSWSDSIEILECCGCGKLSVRHESWFSEWDEIDEHPITGKQFMRPGIKTALWPTASARTKPDWADELKDDVLRKVLDEVYTALDHGLTVLAATGTRTLLDRAMYISVGDPNGGFSGKLDAMAKDGRIGRHEKTTFLAMVDVGSAAAHRGFEPGKETLDKVITATESLLQREFVLPADAEAVRKATPARPKRAPKKGGKT